MGEIEITDAELKTIMVQRARTLAEKLVAVSTHPQNTREETLALFDLVNKAVADQVTILEQRATDAAEAEAEADKKAADEKQAAGVIALAEEMAAKAAAKEATGETAKAEAPVTP